MSFVFCRIFFFTDYQTYVLIFSIATLTDWDVPPASPAMLTLTSTPLNSAPGLCCQEKKIKRKRKPCTFPALSSSNMWSLLIKKQTIVWQFFWCMGLLAGTPLPPIWQRRGEIVSFKHYPPPTHTHHGPGHDLRATWHNLLSGQVIFYEMRTNTIE